MFVAATNTIKIANDGGAEHVDPQADEVLATTENLPAGRYLVNLIITTADLDDSKARFYVQHRDSTDDELNPVEQVVVSAPADGCQQINLGFALDVDERISVVPYAAFVGTVTVALNWQRIS